MSYTLERVKRDIILFIPILFIMGYFLFPEYLFNSYYAVCTSIFTACVILYRFDKLIFIMHQKPTYFNKATVFKTRVVSIENEFDDEDNPETKLIREVDTYLTLKFQRIFKHVLIIIDSFMCGILAYWVFLHFTTDDPDYWVKNVGIFGGYISICGKAHLYIGKMVLIYLKKNKDKVHKKEMKRRLLNEELTTGIELTEITIGNEENNEDNDKDSITKPIMIEGYMDFFEMEYVASTRDFTDSEDSDSKDSESSKESMDNEDDKENVVLDIDTRPPKSALLVNKIRNFLMFKKPKEIGYAPNIIIIHY